MSTISENVVGKLVQEKGHLHRDRIFLMDLLSNRFAGGFRDLGLQKGDKMAIMMKNHPDFLYAWFGFAKPGAVEVPINTAYKGDLLKHIINKSESKLLVIDAPLLERLPIIKDELKRLNRIICHGEIDKKVAQSIPIPILPLDDLFEGPADPPGVEVSPKDPAGIIYTSGTTGLSKGAVCPNNYFLHLARLVVQLREANSGDILYTFLPLFYIDAQLMTVMAALISDARVVLSDRFSASTFWDEMREHGVTQFNYLGVVMTILAKQEPRPDDRDNTVRIAFDTACPPDVMAHLEERSGFVCLEGSGMTEYYNMPDKTLEVYRNLWFHTGDYAKKDADEYCYFMERKKDAIRRRGENISSFEVEKVINTHPKILESAVFAVPSDLGEDEVKANIVLKARENLPPEDLIQFLNERMAYFAIPRYLESVEELPKIPTNRIEKYRLRELGITETTWDREKTGVKITR